MKKTLFTAALLAVFLAAAVSAQQKGWMSRYWDGCKPSCSWIANAGEERLCKECDKDNDEIDPPEQFGSANSCGDGGPSYTCWDMIPFVDPADPNLAYAFAATPGGSNDCGTCYELTFDGGQTSEPTDPFATNRALNGKKVVVMASNIGYDVGGGQFDLLVPGGGLGIFDSFSQQLGVSVSALGERSGGLVSTCQNELVQKLGWAKPGVKEAVVEWQDCLRDKCDAVFGKPEHTLLKQGCRFYADWFMAADNPTLTYKKLDQCPEALAKKYAIGSGGGGVGKPPVVKDTVKTEAEAAPSLSACTSNQDIDQPLCTGTSGDITYIAAYSGNSAVYTVTVPRTGAYSLRIRASNAWGPADIAVTLNGSTDAGKVIVDHTTSWTNYVMVTLRPDVQLNEGQNTIQLRFSGRVNVDYFMLIGERPVSSVKHGAKARTVGANVTVRIGAKGFTAVLPANHGYTSYSVIDLKGREVRRGKISAGAADLRFSNLGNSVYFLKLAGKGSAPAVLRAVTY